MSKWLSHVKKTMKTMKAEKKTLGKKWFSKVLKTAKQSYKKGGAEEAEEKTEETGVDGGRRRRGGKTRRHRK
jgi:hypothetical protein